MATTKRFTTTTVRAPRGDGVVIPVPFDPDQVWGRKPRHHVNGTIGTACMRGVVERTADGYAIRMGPAWARDCGVAAGTKVAVKIAPEGPQRDDLAPDVRAALDADQKAGEFWDALAQFYRKGYLRWIDATKRRPDLRAERIAEMVTHLRAGRKERP